MDPLFKTLEGETSVSDSMKFEWARLSSFASFRSICYVSSVVLARSGFYYTGTDSTVECYSCGVKWNDWSKSQEILEIHHDISPNCPLLTGNDAGNVPIEHRKEPRPTILERFSRNHQQVSDSSLSTIGQLINNRQQPRLTHRTPTLPSGRYANERRCRCVEQSMRLIQLQTDTESLNNARSPNEYGMSSSGVSNQEMNNPGVKSVIINKLSPLGVNFDKPRYLQYAVLTVRVNTYNGWPATQSPRKMAEAGFLYAGYSDYTRCFFCGGGLRNWGVDDDPWIEHARWFPRCTYVKQNKGDDYVHQVQQLLGEKLRTTEEKKKDTISAQQKSPIPDLPKSCETASVTINRCHRTDYKHMTSYQSVLDIGYAPDLIENAVQQLVGQGIETFTSSDLLEVIFRIEENLNVPQEEIRLPVQATNDPSSPETASLMEENRRLKEQRLCMICVEKDSCITFLPCGHLVCCEECAPAMRKCPKCQKVVQGSIKTWLV